MFKIEALKTGQVTTLKLEGRLVGPWVDEAESAWLLVVNESAKDHGRQIVIDLSELTFIDKAGKHLLLRMHEAGGEMRTRDVLIASIVDEIRKISCK